MLFAILFGTAAVRDHRGRGGGGGRRAARERGRRPQDPGIGTVRRLFVYVLALVGLSFATTGIALLITGALEVAFENMILADESQSLATALAFTLVGTPAWFVFAALAQRSLRDHAVEARSHARRLYFVLARAIALGFITVNGISVIRAAIGVDDFSAGAWGWLLAWSGVWLLHARLVANEPTSLTTAARAPGAQFLERLYWYLGAVVGLFLLVDGDQRGGRPGRCARCTTASSAARCWSVRTTPTCAKACRVVAVGAVVWGWHWLRALVRKDRGTSLWHVQIFVFGTLPGIALTVIPLAILLYRALQWLVGRPSAATVAAHFSDVPSLLAALVVGALTWGYHRAVLRDAGEDSAAAHKRTQSEPERLYRYLVIGGGAAHRRERPRDAARARIRGAGRRRRAASCATAAGGATSSSRAS